MTLEGNQWNQEKKPNVEAVFLFPSTSRMKEGQRHFSRNGVGRNRSVRHREGLIDTETGCPLATNRHFAVLLSDGTMAAEQRRHDVGHHVAGDAIALAQLSAHEPRLGNGRRGEVTCQDVHAQGGGPHQGVAVIAAVKNEVELTRKLTGSAKRRLRAAALVNAAVTETGCPRLTCNLWRRVQDNNVFFSARLLGHEVVLVGIALNC